MVLRGAMDGRAGGVVEAQRMDWKSLCILESVLGVAYPILSTALAIFSIVAHCV